MAAGTPQTLPSGRDVLGIAREVTGTVTALPSGVTQVQEANADSAVWDDVVALLRDIRDECRATRLAVQDLVNRGERLQADYLELARELNDNCRTVEEG